MLLKFIRRNFVTMDTKMLHVNKFLDFRLSLPQTSLIINLETFSSRQNNRISVIWKETKSNLFLPIYRENHNHNNKPLVNKLMLHCLQKRTKLTVRIVFEQIKMPSLSSKVLFIICKRSLSSAHKRSCKNSIKTSKQTWNWQLNGSVRFVPNLVQFQLMRFVEISKYKFWMSTILFEYHKFNLSVDVFTITMTWGAVF